MATRIAVDVGYGYVKAVDEGGRRVVMPSVVCPDPGAVEGLGRSLDYRVTLRGRVVPGGLDGEQVVCVGELAQEQEARAVRTLAERRYTHPSMVPLLATAAAVLHREGGPVRLLTGLPLEYVREQRKDFQEFLARLDLEVKVEGYTHGFVPLWVAESAVYAQGVAALLSAAEDPDLVGMFRQGYGFVGLVDAGYRTTDVTLVSLETMAAVTAGCRTIEDGLHRATEAVLETVRRRVGRAVGPAWLERLLLAAERRKAPVKVGGVEMDLARLRRDAEDAVARDLWDQVLALWEPELDLVHCVLLAGGGAEALRRARPVGMRTPLHVLSEPQFANARGYLVQDVRLHAAARA